MIKPIPPFFNGQQVFGNLDYFVQVQFETGSLAEIESFLGQSVEYGADSAGQLYPVTGMFTGSTEGEVTDQVSTLQSLAGIVSMYRKPTGDIPPADLQLCPNCYFTLGDMSFGSIQQLGINYYGQTYSLLIRRKGVN